MLRLEWDFVLQIWNVIYSEGIVQVKLHVTCTMSCRNTGGTVVIIYSLAVFTLIMTMIKPWVHNPDGSR